jgi:hypothetical protein
VRDGSKSAVFGSFSRALWLVSATTKVYSVGCETDIVDISKQDAIQ